MYGYFVLWRIGLINDTYWTGMIFWSSDFIDFHQHFKDFLSLIK